MGQQRITVLGALCALGMVSCGRQTPERTVPTRADDAVTSADELATGLARAAPSRCKPTGRIETCSNTWRSIKLPGVPFSGFTLTMLSSGSVLLAGGCPVATEPARHESAGSSSFLFDPGKEKWVRTGSMVAPRCNHRATLLDEGTVLVTDAGDGTAEVYDSSTGTWSPTGATTTPFTGAYTLTALSTGGALIAGGKLDRSWRASAAAELYDAATGSWAPTGSMLEPRNYHTATALPDQLLVVGGTVGLADDITGPLTQLYAPGAGTWAFAGDLPGQTRTYHSASLLPSGDVVVAGGGFDLGGGFSASAAAFAYSAGWRVVAEMPSPRFRHAAAVLPSGKLLLAGGMVPQPYGQFVSVSSAVVYDPASDAWSEAAPMSVARGAPVAVTLPSGDVLVVGEGSAEIYTE